MVAHIAYDNEIIKVTVNWRPQHSSLRKNIPSQGQFDLIGKVKHGSLNPCSLKLYLWKEISRSIVNHKCTSDQSYL